VSAASQPIENASVEVRTVGVTIAKTDTAGRYRAEVNNDSPMSVWATAYHEQFPFQPCATSFEETERGNVERSIDIVLTSVKGPANVPSASVPGRRKVLGTVVTMTSEGRTPVRDAFVAWEFAVDDHRAWTETDVAGRFALCGLPVNRRLWIYADELPLEPAWVVVEPGTDDANIELVLK
jgi:hypothetical protein